MNRTFLAALTVCICSSALHADLYTETYDGRPGDEDAPGASDYAAIVRSPFGVVYDFYEDRAGRRFVEEEHFGMVVGSMDEAFYWGHNDQLHGPGWFSCCRAAGDLYCDADNTGYLFNGYGTGYPTYLATGEETDFVLGITFMDPALTGYRDTQVQSVKFGYAGGSNNPSAGVTIRGMQWQEGVGFVDVWSYSTDITYSPTDLSTLVIPDDYAPVNRIEIDRLACPIWCAYHGHRDDYGAWYILDDLTFDISNWGNPTPSGGYEWVYYTEAAYDGATAIPAPGAVVLGMAGLGILGWLKRKGIV